MLVIKSQKQAEVNFIHALLSRLEVAKQTVTVWIVFPKRWLSPNSQHLWVWLYLEIWALQMIKLRWDPQGEL